MARKSCGDQTMVSGGGQWDAFVMLACAVWPCGDADVEGCENDVTYVDIYICLLHKQPYPLHFLFVPRKTYVDGSAGELDRTPHRQRSQLCRLFI